MMLQPKNQMKNFCDADSSKTPAETVSRPLFCGGRLHYSNRRPGVEGLESWRPDSGSRGGGLLPGPCLQPWPAIHTGGWDKTFNNLNDLCLVLEGTRKDGCVYRMWQKVEAPNSKGRSDRMMD
jgi:hypothetical protein